MLADDIVKELTWLGAVPSITHRRARDAKDVTAEIKYQLSGGLLTISLAKTIREYDVMFESVHDSHDPINVDDLVWISKDPQELWKRLRWNSSSELEVAQRLSELMRQFEPLWRGDRAATLDLIRLVKEGRDRYNAQFS